MPTDDRWQMADGTPTRANSNEFVPPDFGDTFRFHLLGLWSTFLSSPRFSFRWLAFPRLPLARPQPGNCAL